MNQPADNIPLKLVNHKESTVLIGDMVYHLTNIDCDHPVIQLLTKSDAFELGMEVKGCQARSGVS